MKFYCLSHFCFQVKGTVVELSPHHPKVVGLSPASRFCHQVAALPDIFCRYVLQKCSFCESHKIANNSATTEARVKISTDLESLEFFYVCSNKLKNYQILLNKMSHRFLVTTKLFSGWKNPNTMLWKLKGMFIQMKNVAFCLLWSTLFWKDCCAEYSQFFNCSAEYKCVESHIFILLSEF